MTGAVGVADFHTGKCTYIMVGRQGRAEPARHVESTRGELMNQSNSEIPQIDPDHALTEVEAGRAALVDVREMEEWTAGHAGPARHVPVSLITEGDVSDLNLDADRAVITVCRSGRRSQTAAVALAAQGISASNLVGGMQAWEAAGHRVVTDDGQPGVVV